MKPAHSLWLVRFLTIGALAVAVLPATADDKGRREDEGVARVRGRIVEVRPNDGQVILRVRRGQDLKLTVDDHTRLQLNERNAKLGDFKEGTRVRVTYIPGPKNRVVYMGDPLITLERIRQGVDMALEQAKSLSYRKRDEYRRDMEAVLRDLDERIADLKDAAAKTTGDARAAFDREMKELQRKREVAREKLARVEAAAPEMWDDIKAGVNDALTDLQKALERARSRVREKEVPQPDRK
jgi:hypothetical protein